MGTRSQGFLITLQAFVAVDSTDMDKMTATAAAIKAAKENGDLSGLTGEGLTLLSFKQKYMTKDISGALPTPARVQTDTAGGPLPIEQAIANGTEAGVYGEAVEVVGSTAGESEENVDPDGDNANDPEPETADDNVTEELTDPDPADPETAHALGAEEEQATTSGRRGGRRG